MAGTAAYVDLDSVAIDKGDQFLGPFGEQLKFAGIERLGQQLKQEEIRAVRECGADATKEKAEPSGRLRQGRETRVCDRGAELHRARAQCTTAFALGARSVNSRPDRRPRVSRP